MKPSEYKWSEWIRAIWRCKIFEWKAEDFFGDEWADGIATLETANAELLEALDLICRLATNAGTAPLSLEIALNILLDIATLALDNKHKGE